jgi:hypothetical protein
MVNLFQKYYRETRNPKTSQIYEVIRRTVFKPFNIVFGSLNEVKVKSESEKRKFLFFYVNLVSKRVKSCLGRVRQLNPNVLLKAKKKKKFDKSFPSQDVIYYFLISLQFCNKPYKYFLKSLIQKYFIHSNNWLN